MSLTMLTRSVPLATRTASIAGRFHKRNTPKFGVSFNPTRNVAPLIGCRNFSSARTGSSRPTSSAPNNGSSGGDSGNKSEFAKDMELQESYDGLIPRLITLADLLIDGSIESFKSIVDDTIILREQKSDSLMRQLLIYADLKNPLLMKYGFESKDFLAGAKHAVAVTLQHIVSRDLNSYLIGEKSSSEANDFLLKVLHPAQYWNKVATIRNVHKLLNTATGPSSLRINPSSHPVPVRNYRVTVESIGLINVKAEVVRTQPPQDVEELASFQNQFVNIKVERTPKKPKATAVVSGKDEETVEVVRGASSEAKLDASAENMTNAADAQPKVSDNSNKSDGDAATASASASDANSTSKATEQELMDEEQSKVYPVEDLLSEYPLGSVVLTVRTVVRARYTSLDEEESDTMLHAISFRGCVSGKNAYNDNSEESDRGDDASTDANVPELNWKIIDIQQ